VFLVFLVLLMLQAEEKMKFDTIFDSLFPVGGYLTGDKVKPVLLNSKLPVDVLGRVGRATDHCFRLSSACLCLTYSDGVKG
jgi:hypothetical protein